MTDISAIGLWHGPFRRFWSARVLSTGAVQIQAVAVGWQIYDLTGSPLQLGLIGLAQFLPVLLLSLPAGYLADSRDRTRVAAFSQAAAGLVVLGMALGSAGHWLTPKLIYTAVVLASSARALQQPALSSLLPALVPVPLFPRAAALSASAIQTATILGPALGGLLYGIGPAIPYAVCAAMLLSGSALTLGLRPIQATPPRTPPGWHTVLQGLRFIAGRPVILGAISLDLFAVLLGGATALLPVFARDILHAGPFALGLLRGAPAVGALALSALLARFPLQRRVGPRMFAAVILFGAATVAFALSRSIGLSVAALAVLGAADIVSVVVRQTLVQLRTPDEMRGRVSAINFLFIGTSNQLGEFESGVTAALLGTVPAALLGGIGTIVVAILWMRLFPALRRMDRFDDPAPQPGTA